MHKNRHYHVWAYADDVSGRMRTMRRGQGYRHRNSANRILHRDFFGAGHVLRCNDPTCKLDEKLCLPSN